jgi:hypothetical protein
MIAATPSNKQKHDNGCAVITALLVLTALVMLFYIINS